MFLREFWNYDDDGDFKDNPRYSPEEDTHSTQKFKSRKSRLTLRQINKLRLMADVKKFEKVSDLKLIRKQFGQVPDEDGPLL